MTLTTVQIAAALDAIQQNVGNASANSDSCNPFADDIEWPLRIAYGQLLTLAEALQLPLLRADIQRDFEQADKHGLSVVDTDEALGYLYLSGAIPARRYISIMRQIFATQATHAVTKDLESIIRAATYSITDNKIFPSTPTKELDVHRRIENVLRCVFPDLITEPTITKPIKNFKPDTGIPSIQTLIEYKFIDDESKVATVSDEILADTRGYPTREWTSFVFVIYETRRFREENRWRHHLRECGIDLNTSVVVLHGEPFAR